MKRIMLLFSALIIIGLAIVVLVTSHNITQQIVAIIGLLLFAFGAIKEFNKNR